MTSIFSLDYETASEADIISYGAYRYACDPSTVILMFAISKDESEPLLWRIDQPDTKESKQALAWLREAVETEALIFAHNSEFESAVSQYVLERQLSIKAPKIDQWRCTQAMCRRAAAPESLAAASEFFDLGDKKNPIGKALIDVFSKLDDDTVLVAPDGMIDPSTQKTLKNGTLSKGTKPKNLKSRSPIFDSPVLWDWRVKVKGDLMTVREAWEHFCAYCKQDVRAEQDLHRKLKHFELKGDILESFLFNARMNARGVPVNRKALRHALTVVEYFQQKLEARFVNMCGLRPSQRDAVKVWLQERGYPEDDLQAGTVDKILEKPPESMTPLAVEVLRTRSLIGFAALAKIPTMLNAACTDGRVRGTLMWHAARTGRDGGRVVQPQNFKKATIEDSEFCYQMILDEFEPEWFDEFWGSPLEAIASSIRHFIQPEDGLILDGDYTGVEALLTAWAVGDEAEMDRILRGVDLYKFMAVRIFNVSYDEVVKLQRTICKPVVLGCGFGGSGRSIQEALAKPPYNVNRTRKECNEYVAKYRETHPDLVAAWGEMDEAAKSAIAHPGVKFKACKDRAVFQYGAIAGIPYLTMRLPSGRKIYYPRPEVKPAFKPYDKEEMAEDPKKAERGGYWVDQITFYCKVKGKNWGRGATWGSKLLENFIQAIGADLLNHGCLVAERRGFDLFLRVHDQALSHHKGQTIEEFNSALCDKPAWAETFPLSASAAIHPYYLKD